MRKIILASQSPQRQALMATLPIQFEVIPAHIDEKAITHLDPLQRAALVAAAKAEKIAKLHPDAIVIAGDTYVVLGTQVLEKPESLEEAKQMLTDLSGQEIEVVTGFCYLDPLHKIEVMTTLLNPTRMRTLYPQEIETFIKNEPVLTWSAAFCPAYVTSAALIASVQGSFTSFSHGLPIELVTQYLRQSQVL